MASWFDRHKRFDDCMPNEVYIGQGAFAEFDHLGVIRIRKGDVSITIDHGGVSILSGALQEWTQANR